LTLQGSGPLTRQGSGLTLQGSGPQRGKVLVGTLRAIGNRMTVRDFQDLVCWRLSDALKCEVCAFTETGRASRDFKYCDQIRNSSASAPRNIAEAFGRFRPKDAARFAEFAVASLEETRSDLIDGHDRGYLTTELFSRLWNLSDRALRATKNWMLYLKRRAAHVGGGGALKNERRPPRQT
jgi:four helix bundle protein